MLNIILWKEKMKKIFLIIITVLMLMVLVAPSSALAASPIVNGSFETGDYSGWTLWEGQPYYHWPQNGTWGIASNGQTINPGDTIYDYYDNIWNTQWSPGLPITYTTSDGNYMAIQLQSGPETHRMYQDVTLSNTTTSLSLDMFYNNHETYIGFSDRQYLAIHVRDLNDNILQTLFKTVQGDPLSIPMSNFVFDISAFAGSTIRIDIEMEVQAFYFDAGFDNFVIGQDDPSYPPGWSKGKKKGWDEGTPPGLAKKDKTPSGFEKGNKSGWE